MSKTFAAIGDISQKASFDQIGPGLYAFSGQGNPHSGVIIGEDAVMIVDAQATPAIANDLIACIGRVTDKPVKYVLLTHFHAVRTLGASAFKGAQILASDATRGLIAERGRQDMECEIARFPALFMARDGVAGLTWPTITFPDQMSVWLGTREVRIMHVGRGHTAGDVIAAMPDCGVVFAGDLVTSKAACYCGDAHFTDWPATLDNLAEMQASTLVPGRGDVLASAEDVKQAIDETAAFVTTLFASVQDSVGKGLSLKDT